MSITDPSKEFTILCVDDEPAMGMILRRFLKNEGYQVIIAQDGFEALNLATKMLPGLILLDLMMPDMDGFEVLKKLKDQPLTSEIPVIILSARSDTDDIVRGLKLGAADYMVKPFEWQELLVRVEVIIRLHELHAVNKRKISERNPIFLSYCRADWSRFVNPLVSLLEEEGLPIWIDQHLIDGSDDWLDEINKALKAASRLIVCVTPKALESRYVKMEYRYAFNNGKPIYPLICRRTDLPAELQIVQHYPYSEVNKLVESLKRK